MIAKIADVATPAMQVRAEPPYKKMMGEESEETRGGMTEFWGRLINVLLHLTNMVAERKVWF